MCPRASSPTPRPEKEASTIADNVTIKDAAGVDRTLSTNEIFGTHFERAKIGYGVTGAYVDVSSAAPLPVAGLPGIQIAGGTEAWANNAAALTENTIDLGLGSSPNPGRLLAVFVRNPSPVAALIGKIQHSWVDPNGGATRYADLSNPAGISTFTVQTSNVDGQVFLVDGGMLSVGAARLSLKNIVALGAADGFTASVRVFALCAI